jgi:Trk-type K+ transport system membrane component
MRGLHAGLLVVGWVGTMVLAWLAGALLGHRASLATQRRVAGGVVDDE